MSIMAVKEHTVGVINLGEKIQKILACSTFPQCVVGCPRRHVAILHLMSYYKAHSSFTIFIIGPEAGNLLTTTKSCQIQVEFTF